LSNVVAQDKTISEEFGKRVATLGKNELNLQPMQIAMVLNMKIISSLF
jgi:hypothetical protein